MEFLLTFPLFLLLVPANNRMFIWTCAYAVLFYIFVTKKKVLGKPEIKFKIDVHDKSTILFSFVSILTCSVIGILFVYRYGNSIKLVTIAFILSVFSFISILFLWLKIRSYSKEKLYSNFKNFLYTPCFGRKESILATVLFFVVYIDFQSAYPLWANSDNYWISNVLNGVYSTENYCIFVNPLLSKIVKIIDGVIPTADGFVLLCEFAVSIGIFFLFYLLLTKMNKRDSFLIIFFFIFGFVNMIHAVFTFITAIIACFGFFFCFEFLTDCKKIFYLILGLFEIFIASIIRFESFKIIIPFALLVLVFELICNKECLKFIKKNCLCGSKHLYNMFCCNNI